MLFSEFREFRAEVVDAEKKHPEWRKQKWHIYDTVPTIIPATPGARDYWRIRNGTQGLVRKYVNTDEGIALRLGDTYDPHDYEIDDEDARLVEKWRKEWSALCKGQKRADPIDIAAAAKKAASCSGQTPSTDSHIKR